MNKSLSREAIKQQVLTLLINKYENSGEGSSVFVTIPDTAWEEVYTGGKVHPLRERIHVALRELESEGLANVLWAWRNDEYQVSKVYLNLRRLEQAVLASGLSQRNKEIASMQQVLEPLSSHPWDFVRAWHSRTQALLSQGKTLGLCEDTHLAYADLVKALKALSLLNYPTTVSQFSVSVYNDPDYFNLKVRSSLIKLLRDASPEVYSTDEELLDSVNLSQTPQLAMLAGHLHFAINNVAYNLALFPEGLGLPFACAEALEITHLSAKRVVVVCSRDAYFAYARQAHANRDLVILATGYPHYGVRTLLRKLAQWCSQNNSTSEVYYAGEINYLGMRIFEHLRKHYFAVLKPLGMDPQAYEASTERGQPMPEAEATKLDYLLQNPEYSDWVPLLIAMLQKRIV